MKERNISEYMDIYATYVWVKDKKREQDYIVLPSGKDKGNKSGKIRKQYN